MQFKIPSIDFVGIRRYAIAFSIMLTLVGLVLFIVHGGFRMGIDFKGGISLQIKVKENIHSDMIRAAMTKNGFAVMLQVYGKPEKNEFLLKIPAVEKDNIKIIAKVETALETELGKDNFTILAQDLVGPTMGKYLTQQAVWLVILSCGLILIYITIRFQFDFALGAIIALVHDVLVALTAVIIADKEMTITIIAAILTIIGYSINDTIVVYDRIREGITKYRDLSFPDIINRSINETLNRTIITVLTVLMVVLALFLFGGPVIHDFAFVMLVGVTTGMYSSIFIASPIIIELHALRDRAIKKNDLKIQQAK